MNMSGKKTFLLILFLALSALNYTTALAADGDSLTKKDPHDYSLILYGGGGLTVYRGTSGVSDVVNTDLTKTGIGGTLRIMWHPDHLLRLGIETGYVPF
jgi:hypothetical protein